MSEDTAVTVAMSKVLSVQCLNKVFSFSVPNGMSSIFPIFTFFTEYLVECTQGVPYKAYYQGNELNYPEKWLSMSHRTTTKIFFTL